jgi:hypothetical protein
MLSLYVKTHTQSRSCVTIGVRWLGTKHGSIKTNYKPLMHVSSVGTYKISIFIKNLEIIGKKKTIEFIIIREENQHSKPDPTVYTFSKSAQIAICLYS